MNTGYGRLKDAEIEYAPDTLVLDGVVVTNPTAETYLKAGWKRVVDEPPKAEPFHVVMPSEWEEYETTLTRIYKQVPRSETDEARTFSKLKLVAALKAIDKWVLVRTWIAEKGYFDLYLAAQNFREDNPDFIAALAELKEYAGMTDAEIDAVLEQCIWDGP
mgnify:CR=1 FL=1